MAPYHHMLAHFPVALLSLAFLMVLFRSFSDHELARRLDGMLPYVVGLGLAGGVAAFASGLLVWPLEAAISTPMGRNKILVAVWMLACWTAVLALRSKGGSAVWHGQTRWAMLGLSTIGGILIAVAGTLGGHLLGSPSRLSGGLRAIGWDVYRTFYAPTWVVAVMVIVALAMVAVGIQTRQTRR